MANIFNAGANHVTVAGCEQLVRPCPTLWPVGRLRLWPPTRGPSLTKTSPRGLAAINPRGEQLVHRGRVIYPPYRLCPNRPPLK